MTIIIEGLYGEAGSDVDLKSLTTSHAHTVIHILTFYGKIQILSFYNRTQMFSIQPASGKLCMGQMEGYSVYH